MSGVIIWAETKDGQLRKPVLEAISFANTISHNEIHVVVMNSETAAEDLAKYPVTTVHHVQGDEYNNYQSESYTDALFSAVKATGAKTVVNAATTLGRDLSARLAARMNAVLATDVTSVNNNGDDLIITRPVYSGKLMAEVALTADNKVITIRPNTFDPAETDGQNSPVNPLTPELQAIRAQVQEAVASAQDSMDVTEADIIVSGGRGVGGPEGFELVETAARNIGAAVGASRTAVDEGWIPYKHQVGQTGKVVTPVLYVACGISGAIQHFAGMGSSKFIIAINTDPEAPIMEKADFAIVGDLFKVLPILQEELAKIVN